MLPSHVRAQLLGGPRHKPALVANQLWARGHQRGTQGGVGGNRFELTSPNLQVGLILVVGPGMGHCRRNTGEEAPGMCTSKLDPLVGIISIGDAVFASMETKPPEIVPQKHSSPQGVIPRKVGQNPDCWGGAEKDPGKKA